MNVRTCSNNNSNKTGAKAVTTMMMKEAFVFVLVAVVVCTTTTTTTTDALTPNSSSSSKKSASASYYSMLSSSSSSSSSKKNNNKPFGIGNKFALHESTNGLNGDDGGGDNGWNNNTNNNKELDLKSKSDSDIVNGIHYPSFPSPPIPPPAVSASSSDDSSSSSSVSYFTDTSSSPSSPSSSAKMDENKDGDKSTNIGSVSSYNFLSVDGNGSGGLMGRSEGTGGTDATLMMGDTAKNKATPVDSGSVHLPTTQDLLKSSSLTEVAGNSVVRGPVAEQRPMLTNASDEPIARPTVPQNDDTATSLHVSNIVFSGPSTTTTTAASKGPVAEEAVENVIPTILKRYVPPPKENKQESSSSSSPSSSSSSLKGTSTGGANHFASPEVPKIKVRRFVPGQDDGIFKHPEPKSNNNQSDSMLPVHHQKKKLKPYTKPVPKPPTKIALPEGAVAVSTTTLTSSSSSALAYHKTPTPTTLSEESATTKPKSTKLVRIVSEETTSTIPYDNPKDRYSNEFQGPTSATLHQKTGLQVNTPVSLWQPRDKFLDH